MAGMYVGRANMFRSEADSYNPRRNALQNRKSAKQPEKKGELEGIGSPEDATDDSALNGDLQFLGGARGIFAPELYGLQIGLGDVSRRQLGGENIDSGYRVLYRQIDSDAANR